MPSIAWAGREPEMRGLTREEYQMLRYLESHGPQAPLDHHLQHVLDALEDRGLIEVRFAFSEVRPVDDEWEDVIDVFEPYVTDDGRLALRVCIVEG